MNLVLFETTDSVIEVLWDIALAMFILRLAFIYFLLSFVSGTAMVYLAYTAYPQSGVALAPFLLLSFALWSYVVVSRYEIPRVTGFRLATGAVALLYMVAADGAVGLGLWEQGYGEWAGQRVGLGFCGLLAAFALMPTVLMAFEARPSGKREERTWHGHEDKHIVDAV